MMFIIFVIYSVFILYLLLPSLFNQIFNNFLVKQLLYSPSLGCMKHSFNELAPIFLDFSIRLESSTKDDFNLCVSFFNHSEY